jgi:hypothetical protein
MPQNTLTWPSVVATGLFRLGRLANHGIMADGPQLASKRSRELQPIVAKCAGPFYTAASVNAHKMTPVQVRMMAGVGV